VPTYSALTGLRELRIVAPNPVDDGYNGVWTIELRSTLSGSSFDQFGGGSLPGATGITVRFSEDDGNGFGYSYLVDSVANGTLLATTPARPAATGTRRFSRAAPSRTRWAGSRSRSTPWGHPARRSRSATPRRPRPWGSDRYAAGRRWARLDWTASTDNLGLAGYNLYRDGALVGSAGSSALTYTDPPALGVSGLHTYSIKAADTAGLLSGAVFATATLQSAPDAPGGVTATPGNKAAMVGWTAPFNGGATITGYTVSSTPGGAYTCTTTGATSCVRNRPHERQFLPVHGHCRQRNWRGPAIRLQQRGCTAGGARSSDRRLRHAGCRQRRRELDRAGRHGQRQLHSVHGDRVTGRTVVHLRNDQLPDLRAGERQCVHIHGDRVQLAR